MAKRRGRGPVESTCYFRAHAQSAKLDTRTDGQTVRTDGQTDRRTDELPANDQMWGSLTLAPNYYAYTLVNFNLQAGQPLRASSENQFPPHGFPGPSSQSGLSGFPSSCLPPSSVSATAVGSGGGGGGGLNNLDGPGLGASPRQPATFRPGDPMGLGGNPPNQLNDLNQPLPQVC